jgi:hypothetical protein
MRVVTLVLLAFVAVLTCYCSSVSSKFQVGQVWSYKNAPAANSHVVVVEVHKDRRYQEVVFVAVDGLDITTADEREIHRVFSMPFSRAALDESVISLVRRENLVEPSNRGELGGPTYEEWKRMNGMAITSTVSVFLDALRHSRIPDLRYDPPLPNSPSPS